MSVPSRKSWQFIVFGRTDGREPLPKGAVLKTNGRSVRLGFDGADELPVHCFEAWKRIRASNPPESPMEGPVAPVA